MDDWNDPPPGAGGGVKKPWAEELRKDERGGEVVRGKRGLPRD